MSMFKTLLVPLLIASVNAQSSTASAAACSSTIAPQNAQPSVAPGWSFQVVASGLKGPRGIIFDSSGNLLVVQLGHGISKLTLDNGSGACVKATGKATDVVTDSSLMHGIELSADGKTLYASSSSTVYAWDYDPSQGRNTSGPRQVVGNMGNASGHVTRTLLLSRQVEGMLLVSRGSQSNLDLSAEDITTGVSTIKAFNVTNATESGYDFSKDGTLLGWGLRNSVGVAEHPTTGGIYSVENSVDDFERNGKNIHQNNPGEEMNFHGYLNGTHSQEQGGNYGYPKCFAAWNVSEIPQNEGLQVGAQFSIGSQNATNNDTFCREQHVPPRLTFAAHMAPLDLKFNSNGTAAWVTFHGSWDRDQPIGYKLSVIEFANGVPVEPANSSTAAIDIASNADNSVCPAKCFRPVAMAWDAHGRLFMSSDTTGEIYVLARSDGGSANQATPTSGPAPSGTSGAAPPAKSSGAASRVYGGHGEVSKFALVLAGVMAISLL